jgi:hypothetical protein
MALFFLSGRKSGGASQPVSLYLRKEAARKSMYIKKELSPAAWAVQASGNTIITDMGRSIGRDRTTLDAVVTDFCENTNYSTEQLKGWVRNVLADVGN